MTGDPEAARTQLEAIVGPFPSEVRDLHLDSLLGGMSKS
jgi:hypothetical protein